MNRLRAGLLALAVAVFLAAPLAAQVESARARIDGMT